MWFVLGEKVRTKRIAGGLETERECSMCGERTTFYECEVTESVQAYFVDLFEGEPRRVLVCGACGEHFATDELGGAEAAPAPPSKSKPAKPVEKPKVEEVAEDEQEAAPLPKSKALTRGESVSAERIESTALDRPIGGGGGKSPGLFARVGRLFRSRATAAVEKMTDPAKEIDQLILEMEQEMRNSRVETQKIMATQKLAARRAADLQKQVTLWTERAEKAVRAGDDDLAKQAIEQRIRVEESLAEARSEQREAAGYAEKLRESLKRNEGRLKEVKMRQGTIKAKVATHRNIEVRAEALDDFDRMAGKVDDAEVAVEAEAELSADQDTSARDTEVAKKFTKLEKTGGGEIEDRLAALKKKMQDK